MKRLLCRFGWHIDSIWIPVAFIHKEKRICWNCDKVTWRARA